MPWLPQSSAGSWHARMDEVVSDAAGESMAMAAESSLGHHEVARSVLDPEVLAHFDGSAGEGRTARRNIAAFDEYFLQLRTLGSIPDVETSVDSLGLHLPTPVAIAPIGSYDKAAADGCARVAQGAERTGSLLFVSQAARRSAAWWRDRTSAPLCWISYGSDVDKFAAEFASAEQQGFAAVGVTVDSPVPQQIGYRVPPSRDGSPRQGHAVTPEILERLRDRTSLKLVVKGIMTAEDARTALDCGADAIVVSNHGGRTLDGSCGSLDALPSIVREVGGSVEVLFDGGIRRGTDVAVALALGAKLVLVGRPVCWAVASGAEGVAGLINHLNAELSRVLSMTGVSNVAGLCRANLGRLGDVSMDDWRQRNG